MLSRHQLERFDRVIVVQALEKCLDRESSEPCGWVGFVLGSGSGEGSATNRDESWLANEKAKLRDAKVALLAVHH